MQIKPDRRGLGPATHVFRRRTQQSRGGPTFAGHDTHDDDRPGADSFIPQQSLSHFRPLVLIRLPPLAVVPARFGSAVKVFSLALLADIPRANRDSTNP
jgi:hypothetical protein